MVRQRFVMCDYTPVCLIFFVFFFQAEDGIRDWSVTGVQTCALPISWQSLRRLGRESEAAHKSTLAERVTTTRPEDLATIVYTSGTTGPPKGVLQTHGNHIAAVDASRQSTPVEEGWVHLLFLPLAHSFARLASFL